MAGWIYLRTLLLLERLAVLKIKVLFLKIRIFDTFIGTTELKTFNEREKCHNTPAESVRDPVKTSCSGRGGAGTKARIRRTSHAFLRIALISIAPIFAQLWLEFCTFLSARQHTFSLKTALGQTYTALLLLKCGAFLSKLSLFDTQPFAI